MKNILLIQQQAPFNQAKGRESLDLILALAAVEHQVTVLFRDDAVYQLLAADTASSLRLKTYNRSFKLFDLYDVQQVYVCQQSLQKRHLTHDMLTADIQLIAEDDISRLLLDQHHIISC